MLQSVLSRISIFAVLLGGSELAAQQGQLPSVGDLLKQHHNIQLTQSALVEALKNENPQVRYLASQKLAEDKATEAVPAIIQALASERVPWTRMNIGFALAEMGEESGFDALENDCRNRDSGAGVRTQSAEYMLDLNRQSTVCKDALLDVLQTGSNGYRMKAASILPRFHDLSAEDSEKVFSGLVNALRDANASLRIEAGRALVEVGDRRASAELKKALVVEQEETVRLQIEEDLKILREKAKR